MKIDLPPATAHDEPALSRLMQLYAYDFSEFMGWDVGDDALFAAGEPLSSCWSAPWRHAFLLRIDDRLAGFAMVDERSRLTNDPEVCDVRELFVMRKYRRRGIGSACAARVFDLFPRKWEVRQVAKNVAATEFWRKAIGAYTGNRFHEVRMDDERFRGTVQSFDARNR